MPYLDKEKREREREKRGRQLGLMKNLGKTNMEVL